MTGRDLVLRLAGSLTTATAFQFVRYVPVEPGRSRARGLTGIARVEALVKTSVDDVMMVRASRLRSVEALEHAVVPSTPEETVGLASTVLTGRESQRLLLLDFSAPPSKAVERDILTTAHVLGWRGWLLESGASYHWMGAELLPAYKWRRAMGQALLCPAQVDARFIGHSLDRDMAALRLFPCAAKPADPVVVGSVGVDQ